MDFVEPAWEATAVWNPAGHYAVSLSRVRHGNVSFCLLVMQIGGSVDMTPPVAVASALANMQERVNGRGGVICIDSSGEPGIGYSTEKMAWAVARPGRPTVGGIHAPTAPDLRREAGFANAVSDAKL